MTNLKLITTENFGDLSCNFYRNMNDDILLTREQIGTALEYANPREAIKNIHRKHRDRLEALCVRIKLSGCQSEPTSKSEEQECVYYSQRGVMEICRFSRQKKANEFMDWVWTIVEKYRAGELTNQLDTRIINQIVTSLSNINDRLSNLESKKESQETKQIPSETLHKKPFNPWFARMSPKYSLLEDYFDITRGQLYKNILLELENLYDLDTQQIQADYCYENNITTCYPLDPYQFNKRYRDAIELLVNDTLTKYGIVSEDNPIATRRHQTIFDKPAMKCI